MLKRLWSFRREAIGAITHWSGVGRLFEFAVKPTGAIVLMYHSVATDSVAEFIDPPNRLSPKTFEKQMRFLSEYRRVVPLSRVVEQIVAGIAPAAGTVCITFDDGYLDNLTIALPILKEYELPATLFLATGYIERGDPQWADTLHWFFRRRTRNTLRIRSLPVERIDLTSDSEYRQAREILHGHLLQATQHERVELLAEVRSQLRPEGSAPRLTLRWEDVRKLLRSHPLFDIGGHTRGHIDLRTHQGELARLEIDGCAADLRRELSIAPTHFSFPYGRWSAEAQALVRASDWHSAVGDCNAARVGPTTDRFAIPRVDAPRTMTDFRFKTSGAYPGVLSMLGLG